MSLKSGNSRNREDLVVEILQSLFRIQKMQLMVRFVWVPAHIGVEGNEMADKVAKRALRNERKQISVKMSKLEAKSVIKEQIIKKWQEEWNRGKKGRYLYKNKPWVGGSGTVGRNRREESIMTRLRTGHTGLNSSLAGKHGDGKSAYCGEEETVDHVLLHCGRYRSERGVLQRIWRS